MMKRLVFEEGKSLFDYPAAHRFTKKHRRSFDLSLCVCNSAPTSWGNIQQGSWKKWDHSPTSFAIHVKSSGGFIELYFLQKSMAV